LTNAISALHILFDDQLGDGNPKKVLRLLLCSGGEEFLRGVTVAAVRVGMSVGDLAYATNLRNGFLSHISKHWVEYGAAVNYSAYNYSVQGDEGGFAAIKSVPLVGLHAMAALVLDGYLRTDESTQLEIAIGNNWQAFVGKINEERKQVEGNVGNFNAQWVKRLNLTLKKIITIKRPNRWRAGEVLQPGAIINCETDKDQTLNGNFGGTAKVQKMNWRSKPYFLKLTLKTDFIPAAGPNPATTGDDHMGSFYIK
jgi:hypothetical protein